MTKKYSIFLSVLFCVFLGGFMLANLISPDRDFSQMENRTLAQLPKLTPSDFQLKLPLKQSGDFFTGEYMSEFETYVTDQFVGRDVWIGVKSLSELVLGKQESITALEQM